MKLGAEDPSPERMSLRTHRWPKLRTLTPMEDYSAQRGEGNSWQMTILRGAKRIGIFSARVAGTATAACVPSGLRRYIHTTFLAAPPRGSSGNSSLSRPKISAGVPPSPVSAALDCPVHQTVLARPVRTMRVRLRPVLAEAHRSGFHGRSGRRIRTRTYSPLLHAGLHLAPRGRPSSDAPQHPRYRCLRHTLSSNVNHYPIIQIQIPIPCAQGTTSPGHVI